MKVFLIVIFFILALLFIPIPFKLKVHFSNDNIYIKLYNFTIYKKAANNTSNDNASKNKAAKMKKKSKKNSLSTKGKIKLISSIKENKFKPNLYIEGFFKYSLDDAAITAISFGIINTYAPLLTWILSVVFKIKKFKLPITPLFKDYLFIYSEINCIFTISIAKTIFIVILLTNNYIKIKGDELEREKIWA